jgi:hypothetical protein
MGAGAGVATGAGAAIGAGVAIGAGAAAGALFTGGVVVVVVVVVWAKAETLTNKAAAPKSVDILDMIDLKKLVSVLIKPSSAVRVPLYRR